jgi:hypothetical protein
MKNSNLHKNVGKKKKKKRKKARGTKYTPYDKKKKDDVHTNT